MAGKERRRGISSRSAMTTLLWKPVRIRERVVVGLNDTIFAAWIGRHLRRLGWGVHLARSAAMARQLTAEFSPRVVVLDTRLPDESGWLTCEKMIRDDPTLKVVLVASRPERNGAAFAEFVGAATLLRQEDGLPAVIREIVRGSAAVAE
jgi:DNA-binding NtrC family response regulator